MKFTPAPTEDVCVASAIAERNTPAAQMAATDPRDELDSAFTQILARAIPAGPTPLSAAVTP
jgi:hypothetical protein